MLNLGTVRPGSTIYVPFDSFAAATGAPATISNFAVGDIKIYKDGSTTERASTAGFTLLDTDGIDFDAITGINGFSVDLADNTTADFYQAGSKYWVVISTITVDSQTVSFVAAYFEIGYPSAVLNTWLATLTSQTSFTLTDGPAEDNALNGYWAVIHNAASKVKTSRVLISAYTGSTKTVTLAAGATFTAAAKDNFSVMDMASLQPTTIGRTLDVSAGGEAGLDWANIGSPTTSVNLSGTSTKALEPTTAGRTLDVTATGEAGIDWANIGAPTTTVNLSGTSTKAVEPTVAGRTLDVSATGEAGLDWANIGTPGSTQNLSATTISTVSGNVNGSVASVATGGIAAASFAAGAIDAAAIATDAIGSAELAATAANEIADALLDRASAVEGFTTREALRLILAALAAKLSGAATTTVSIRNIADSKDRIVATVDANGNRSAVTYDAT